jgi:hypothetical protein
VLYTRPANEPPARDGERFALTESCPNCNKPVLETDTVCWHCGYQLPKRPKAGPANKPGGGSASRLAGRARPAAVAPVEYDLRSLAVYGLLTLAVILGLWLVMRSLSRQPILVRSAAIDLGGDWVNVTDVDLRYTLSLPTDWQWLDVAYRDQGELLQKVMARQPYVGRALRPLGDAAGDVEILALAVGTQVLEDPDPQQFVVIGASGRMHGLTPQEALDLSAEQSLPVTDQEIDTRLAGQSQARFNILDTSHGYQCRHLFVADESAAGYLVAACAPQSQFGALRHDLDDILDSFQLLVH